MKLQLEPVSMLSGAALLGLCILASSGVQASSLTAAQVSSTLRIKDPIGVVGIPDPAKLIEIREEDGPFTIPAAKRLVLVWSWSEAFNNAVGAAVGPVGVLEDQGPFRPTLLSTDGSGWGGRIFMDGPRTIEVDDGDPALKGRLVGYFVDV